jgi:hypothetical protein
MVSAHCSRSRRLNTVIPTNHDNSENPAARVLRTGAEFRFSLHRLRRALRARPDICFSGVLRRAIRRKPGECRSDRDSLMETSSYVE